jgi:hypothetical protein
MKLFIAIAALMACSATSFARGNDDRSIVCTCFSDAQKTQSTGGVAFELNTPNAKAQAFAICKANAPETVAVKCELFVDRR